MSISLVAVPDKIQVLDKEGQFLCWVDEENARNLIRSRKVTVIRKKNRARVLVCIDADFHREAVLRRDGLTHTRYSHNHECDRADFAGNPEGVWTLVPIPTDSRDVFIQVVTDCGGTRRLDSARTTRAGTRRPGMDRKAA